MRVLEGGLPRYDYMRGLSRSNWAWEALRRNADFQKAAANNPPCSISEKTIPGLPDIKFLRPRAAQTRAQEWGLLFFPDPESDARSADVFWTDAIYPRKLTVYVGDTSRSSHNDMLECLLHKASIKHFTGLNNREQILLRANHQSIQIKCEGLSLLTWTPRNMRLVYDGLDLSGARWKFFESKAEAFLSAKHSTHREWTRKSLARRNAMIAFDCRELGLSIYETAAILYGHADASEAWRGPSDALRQKTLRAIKRGRGLVAGGYKDLLKPRR